MNNQLFCFNKKGAHHFIFVKLGGCSLNGGRALVLQGYQEKNTVV